MIGTEGKIIAIAREASGALTYRVAWFTRTWFGTGIGRGSNSLFKLLNGILQLELPSSFDHLRILKCESTPHQLKKDAVRIVLALERLVICYLQSCKTQRLSLPHRIWKLLRIQPFKRFFCPFEVIPKNLKSIRVCMGFQLCQPIRNKHHVRHMSFWGLYIIGIMDPRISVLP